MQGTHLVIYLSSRRICFYPFRNDVSTFDTITTDTFVVMNYMVMINIKYLKYLRKYSVSVHGNIVILVKFEAFETTALLNGTNYGQISSKWD